RLGSGRSSAKLAGASLVSGVLLAVVTSLVLAIATLALAALHAPPALAGAMGVLVVVVPFALLRDFGRRFSFAHLRMGQALAIDVAASLVQLATLGMLAWRGQLSAVTACIAVGIGSAAAGLPWLYHSRRSFSVAGDTLLPTIVQGWRLGKWFFATQVTLSLQSYISYWLLALIAGVASTGAFVACMSIAVFSNPLTMGLGNILTPRSVHALQMGGVERLRREAGRDTLLLFVLMAAFTLLVAIAGEWVMDLLFDKPEYHGHGGVLVILSLALLASAVGMPASNALASMKQPRSVFWAGLVALVLTVVLVVAFVLICGLLGAAFGFLTGNVAGAAARWMAFRSATSGSSAHGPIEAIRVAEEVVPNASNGRWRLLHRDRGCQADVFILARECADNERPDRLVVKLFRSPETANAEIVRRQMQAMSHLHALLDGTIVHGWKIVVPKPLHFCESPLALVMTHAQGRKACVEMLGRRGGHTIPEVLVAAWEELWSKGETHGDMNVDNILFSDALSQIAFVDAGLPASQPCSSADAAARDLGYLLFDAVVQLKEWRAVLDVAPWRQRFAEQVIDAHLRTFPREDRPRLMRAIVDCAETNIAALDTSWSPHGLWCLLVQRVARRRIEATLRRGICGQNNRIARV
ncbi:MAG: lipopolysaccharide biosynthesis protein, partial [Hyphomicrobiaceae bacterium]|nr:lipopolysaccharide biosynthesis protein [Hyphomicrobiaceae bacterium]